MDEKRKSKTGLRVEIPQGTDESAAVDQVVTDFIKGDSNAVLRDLHEPYNDTNSETNAENPERKA